MVLWINSSRGRLINKLTTKINITSHNVAILTYLKLGPCKISNNFNKRYFLQEKEIFPFFLNFNTLWNYNVVLTLLSKILYQFLTSLLIISSLFVQEIRIFVKNHFWYCSFRLQWILEANLNFDIVICCMFLFSCVRVKIIIFPYFMTCQ